jgi:hypothetical protein
MDNSETLSTLGTQDTGRRQKTHTIKIKHSIKEKKDKLHEPLQKIGVKQGDR